MASKRSSAWAYVPSLYFCEGLPYIMVNTVSTIMYKKMGLSNEFIGLTSVLYLPWVIKMFWSPAVDIHSTRRTWILATQCLLALAFGALALSMHATLFVPLSLASFIAIAFISATHDIAIDGYYMLALDARRQAFFLGVRSLCYRLAVIAGSGLLVVLAGTIELRTGRIAFSWATVMTVVAIIFAAAAVLHQRVLPRPAADTPGSGSGRRSFRSSFSSYFRQPGIVSIVAFILLYRLGEAMLTKMAAPFLLDAPAAGGLGLSTAAVGFVYGTVGVVSLAIGGLLGGWLIGRFGLRRCVWPMVLLLNLPDVLYIVMALSPPGMPGVCAMVACEQFGYGMGFTAFSVFLMYLARAPYQTSHFAISTGLMALGMMLPGMLSGVLQTWLGYPLFFTAVTLLTIPGMLLLVRMPLDPPAPPSP